MRRWVSSLVIAGVLTLGSACQTVGQAATNGVETLQPMAADADPSFAVATIKPSDPDRPMNDVGNPMGHRSVLKDTSVRFLLAFVYDIHDKQIVGGPEWLGTERFDIVGVADAPGAPNLEQFKTMERKLVVERFGLKFHWETREMPAYVLTVGKGGARLAASQDAGGQPNFQGRPDVGMKGRNLTMTNFAQLLQSGILDRPVVDHTGLAGKYDFELKWTPDQTEFGGHFPAGAGDAEAPAGIFTAMPEQLGLKLNPEKTAVRVMVIDSVQQPSAN